MKKTEKAIFACGCFWSVQEEFDSIKGVLSTTVGYTGGKIKNPTYGDVCSGKTGHTEAVEIIFNPQEVSYNTLLDVFFKIHDPTQLNRQGPDIGTQYRSAIFYLNEEQKVKAESKIRELQKKLDQKIVTEVKEATTFYNAEEYHQKYNQKNGKSCRIS